MKCMDAGKSFKTFQIIVTTALKWLLDLAQTEDMCPMENAGAGKDLPPRSISAI